MAVTSETSTELTQIEGSNGNSKPLMPTDLHGRLRFARFNFTQGVAAGDANSLQRLIKLPAGRVRLFLAMSRIACSAFGASRVLDLGWEAYTGDDGVAVVADTDGLDVGQDVSAALGYAPTGTIGADETKLFESQAGVIITSTVRGGTIPAAATLKGTLIYAVD